ncbi:glucosyl-3-phosphoglycerate synthase [Amycolatopsis coloradensis]|uniref:Glucosyl-3-phosphoglycerate synthase n=1 Tax=Amycolatopsis coloradensis TaxID=76021 RepID=A0A1R0L3W6_9PSEU|nr:glucosyl-3-phosphoglycerate synthase [Amycolatopsis coloradensis]OLZ57385.1 glucosyl-3-phosphoglycerate synthase [Amycolatopsis coloradensis]
MADLPTRDAATLPGDVRDWLRSHTSTAADWPASRLMAAKGDTTISVVLPARNEAATVGVIVEMIRESLMRRYPLIDELVVVDSCSTDATARVAAEAGARVVRQDEALPELGVQRGKGEALWKGLASTSGDLVAFIDADLIGCPPEFVTGLLGPLLADPGIVYVKGCYRRPLVHQGRVEPDGGGRVTELVARPLLNLYWPRLAGFVQPLGGEYAGRREVLESVPFATQYGVEIGLLIDLLNRAGLDALAQVDLGQRRHRHQETEALAVMSTQIMLTAFARLAREGRDGLNAATATLAQFRHVPTTGGGTERQVVLNEIEVPERPPLATVRERAAKVPVRA